MKASKWNNLMSLFRHCSDSKRCRLGTCATLQVVPTVEIEKQNNCVFVFHFPRPARKLDRKKAREIDQKLCPMSLMGIQTDYKWGSFGPWKYGTSATVAQTMGSESIAHRIMNLCWMVRRREKKAQGWSLWLTEPPPTPVPDASTLTTDGRLKFRWIETGERGYKLQLLGPKQPASLRYFHLLNHWRWRSGKIKNTSTAIAG